MTSNSPHQPQAPPPIACLHHLKLPVQNLEATLDFYTKVLAFEALPELNHYDENDNLYAVLFKHPDSGVIIELRLNVMQAELQRRWDPIVWAVSTLEDLENWIAWLDLHRVKHSKILKGVTGWVLCAEDPDGKFVKLYTIETHEWTNLTDKDDYWLK